MPSRPPSATRTTRRHTAYSQEAEETAAKPSAAAAQRARDQEGCVAAGRAAEKTEALPSHEPATEHIEKPKTDD